MQLEKMDDFFTKRINGYENQMLNNVEGCKEGYLKVAELLPDNCKTLLDLGCGTGLELKEIFKKHPNINVTGIDLTPVMLEQLKENYPDKNIDLICGDYFKVDFGVNRFDCALSVQTMHHFKHEQKIKLYEKIYSSLKSGGIYIECDYTAKDPSEEDFYFSELARLRNEQNIPDSEFVHYDTPCTAINQIKMFKAAGFKESKKVWQKGNTAIIANTK